MADSDNIASGGTSASFPPFSSSSSDFEFSIILSPSSQNSAAQLCPADELFYKGQLLPLHLSPRLSLVRNLLLSSSSDATVSRDSTGSTSSGDSLGLLEPESSRPSSVTEEDYAATKPRYFHSFTSRFSSFFLNRGSKKDPTFVANQNDIPSFKKVASYSASAKEMIKKYVEKVKPLYEKFSSLQHRPSQHQKKKAFFLPRSVGRTEFFSSSHSYSHSFTGNLQRSPFRMKSAASCPSSMRSSPSHSGLLCSDLLSAPNSSSSSMEELQSAIQAAIAHCKSTMVKQKKLNSFNDDLTVF